MMPPLIDHEPDTMADALSTINIDEYPLSIRFAQIALPVIAQNPLTVHGSLCRVSKRNFYEGRDLLQGRGSVEDQRVRRQQINMNRVDTQHSLNRTSTLQLIAFFEYAAGQGTSGDAAECIPLKEDVLPCIR